MNRPGYAAIVNRAAPLYVVGVVAVHLGLLMYGAVVHGPTFDEVGHLPAGLAHWHTGRFDAYRVNPPLVRTIAAIPLLFRDVDIDWTWEPAYQDSRPEWQLGKQLVERYGPDYMPLLRAARFACLPFAVLALWTIWRWSSELFGPRGGMLSVTVWAFSPLVLTHSQLITPDVGAAAVGIAACHAYRLWALRPTLRRAYVAGILLGLAELTKFTWLLLYAVWPVQWVVVRAISSPRRAVLADLRQLGLIALVSVFVINLGYGFEGSFTRLGDHQFLSSALSGQHSPSPFEPVAGNRFDGSWAAAIPVPIPRCHWAR